MHPSAAERYYLEQRAQRIRAQLVAQQVQAQQVAAQLAASAVSFANAIGSAFSRSGTGAAVRYEEITVDYPYFPADEPVSQSHPENVDLPIFDVPGRFGTALSFVATVTVGARTDGEAAFLWLAFLTTVDGEHWVPLVPLTPNASEFLILPPGGSASTRLHGPFGDRLALRVGYKMGSAGPWVMGCFDDARLTLGVQFA